MEGNLSLTHHAMNGYSKYGERATFDITTKIILVRLTNYYTHPFPLDLQSLIYNSYK